MDFEKLLKEKQETYSRLATRVNQLDQEKNAALTEMLRLEGQLNLIRELTSKEAD